LEANLWESIKTSLRQKNPENRGLDTWINPVRLGGFEDTSSGRRIKLLVPSELHEYWISQHLLDQICAEIAQIYKTPFTVELVVSADGPSELSHDEQQGSSLAASNQSWNTVSQPTVSVGPSAQPSPVRHDFLNRDYTFGTFVVGRNNEFAHAASFSVAENPGGKYNPLFICGPTGMGKTHLLNAVGNFIASTRPDLRIRYIAAERFLTECVAGIRHGDMEKFRQRYREKSDVLLMDDIQVLGRGETVQEEFFNTLNNFFEKNGQVVVASDRMPKDIQGLEDRIRTRLEWGLIADIQMPEIETRVAILRYKAEQRGINLPDEVVSFIARISRRSIRELEGNLNKVKMFTDFQGIPIGLDVVKQILATHFSEVSQLTTEDIQKIVSQHYQIKQMDLKSNTRSKPIVMARQMAMYLAKKYLDKSLTDIGRSFGGRDHTTVINALRRVKDQLDKNTEIKRDLQDLESRIHNITGL